MEARKLLLFLIATILSLSMTSAIQVETVTTADAEACQNQHSLEPLISINNSDGGHAGEPGYYGNQICIESEYSSIRDSCNSDEDFMFSMYDRNNTHISIFEYTSNYQMCAPRLETQAIDKESCGENKTKIASIAEQDNTHVAFPSNTQDPYNQSLCLAQKKPEKITISLEGVSGDFYTDGEQVTQGEKLSSGEVSFPYILNNQPLGIVPYGRFVSLSRSQNSISVTQTDGSFLIPNSKGGYVNVEGKSSTINERIFLGQPEPNFYRPGIDEPVVRVIYDPKYKLEVDREDFRESGEIAVRNKGFSNGENILGLIQ